MHKSASHQQHTGPSPAHHHQLLFCFMDVILVGMLRYLIVVCTDKTEAGGSQVWRQPVLYSETVFKQLRKIKFLGLLLESWILISLKTNCLPLHKKCISYSVEWSLQLCSLLDVNLTRKEPQPTDLSQWEQPQVPTLCSPAKHEEMKCKHGLHSFFSRLCKGEPLAWPWTCNLIMCVPGLYYLVVKWSILTHSVLPSQDVGIECEVCVLHMVYESIRVKSTIWQDLSYIWEKPLNTPVELSEAD